MNVDRTSRLLLRLYPPAWRARYGEELEALILEASGGRVSWRVRLDVARAAGRERLRSLGVLHDGPPSESMRSGSLLVLCAWALFVVAGMGVQKFSEHWQAATPSASRALPTGAFDSLLVGAWIGSVLVLLGVAVASPSFVRFIRSGGWPQVRRRVLTASALTLAAVLTTVPVVIWAHRLATGQRNGGDVGYATGVALWALLLVACLAAWTAAAVAVARRVDLSATVLRLEAFLATVVTVSMAAMTAATAVWWAALARAAPWFLAGRPVGSAASPVAPKLLVATIVMLTATAAAAVGARRSLHGVAAAGKTPRR